MSKQSVNITVCKNCVFSEWEEDEQIGCGANMLQLADKDTIWEDPDGTKFHIVEPMCAMYRDSRWKHKDKKNKVKLARKEICIPVVAHIMAIGGLKKIRRTLKSLRGQALKPTKIVIHLLREDKAESVSEYIQDLKLKKNEVLKFYTPEFRRRYCDLNVLKEDIISKGSDNFTFFIRDGYKVSAELFENIDNHFHSRNGFLFINSDEQGQGLLFLRPTYLLAPEKSIQVLIAENGFNQPKITDFGKIWQSQ